MEEKLRSMKETPLFSELSEGEQQIVAERMRREEYEKGDSLFSKGERGRALYLIASGWVKLVAGGTAVATNLGPGSLLGEADMFLGRPRSTGAYAASQVSLWVLTQRDLTELITDHPPLGLKLSAAFGTRIDQLREYLIQRRLKLLPFLAELRREELLAVAEKLESKTYQAEAVIVQSDRLADTMFIVETGQVEITSDSDVWQVEEGGVFGQTALLTTQPYGITAKALTEVVVWALRMADFRELMIRYPSLKPTISRGLQAPLGPGDRAQAVERLRTIPLFADSSAETLQEVASRLLLWHIPSGEWIFTEGSPGDAMYIIGLGEVKVVSETTGEHKVSHYLKTGDCFGEMALLTGKSRTTAVRAVTDVELWVLHRSDFDELLVQYSSISQGLSKLLGERLAEGEPEPGPTAEAEEEQEPPEPVPVEPGEEVAEVEKAGPRDETRVMTRAVEPAAARSPLLRKTFGPVKARVVPKVVETPPESLKARVAPEGVGPERAKEKRKEGEKEKVESEGGLGGTAIWFTSLSAGGKLRLVGLLMLFIWLCCVSVPFLIIYTVPTTGLNLNPMALLKTPTFTPAPTFTETPTLTPTEAPTEAPMATDTPLPTDTPPPTETLVPTPEPVGTVKVETLKVRSGPGSEYDPVETLEQGDRVTILARNEEGDWVQVLLPGGEEGWVAADLLETKMDITAIAMAEDIPSPPTETPTPEPTPTPQPAPEEEQPPEEGEQPPEEGEQPAPEEPGFPYPAPRLIFPPDGHVFSSGKMTEVVFEWEDMNLAEDEFYNITIRWTYGDIPHFWGDATANTRLQLQTPHWIYGKADHDEFDWWVTVRKKESFTEAGKPDGPAISPDSEWWHFKWY